MKLAPGSNFIKLLSRKYSLATFLFRQMISGAPVATLYKLKGILAYNLSLLSNTFLCLASFCAYLLMGPIACLSWPMPIIAHVYPYGL